MHCDLDGLNCYDSAPVSERLKYLCTLNKIKGIDGEEVEKRCTNCKHSIELMILSDRDTENKYGKNACRCCEKYSKWEIANKDLYNKKLELENVIREYLDIRVSLLSEEEKDYVWKSVTWAHNIKKDYELLMEYGILDRDDIIKAHLLQEAQWLMNDLRLHGGNDRLELAW